MFMNGSYTTLQMSTSSHQSSVPEANDSGSYSLSSSQTFSIYASSDSGFDGEEKYEVWPAKKPSTVDLTKSLILGMPEIPGLASSFSSVDSIPSRRSGYTHAENITDISDNSFRLEEVVEQIKETCNELKIEFVRFRHLDRRRNFADSSDDLDATQAGVLFSRLRIEFDLLEKLMFQEDVLDSELEKQCLSSEFSTDLDPNPFA